MSADQTLAEDLAAEAGQLLVGLRTSGVVGRELGTLGDRESNALLLSRLAAQRPGDAVLSEESVEPNGWTLVIWLAHHPQPALRRCRKAATRCGAASSCFPRPSGR